MPTTQFYNTPQLAHEGLMFYFNLDTYYLPLSNGSSQAITYGWQGLGTIEERTDAVTSDSETIYDDSSGKSRPITTILNTFEQKYEFTVPNVAMPLRQIYLQAAPAVAPSPALPGGTFTSVPISLYPGQPAKIVDTSGVSVVGVTSITSITTVTGSTPLVVNKDWGATKQQLAAGFFNVLPTSTVVPYTTPGPVAALISYVATPVTAAVQFTPGSGPCAFQGQGEMHMVTCGQLQYVDQGYFSIMIASADRNPKKATRFKPTVTRLFDPTGTYPDRFLQYK